MLHKGPGTRVMGAREPLAARPRPPTPCRSPLPARWRRASATSPAAPRSSRGSARCSSRCFGGTEGSKGPRHAAVRAGMGTAATRPAGASVCPFSPCPHSPHATRSLPSAPTHRPPGAVHGGARPGGLASRAAARRRGVRGAGAGGPLLLGGQGGRAGGRRRRLAPRHGTRCARVACRARVASDPASPCTTTHPTPTLPPSDPDPTPQVYSLVLGAFRSHLNSALAELAQRWGVFAASEGGRLAPLVEAMPTRCARAAAPGWAVGGGRTAAQLGSARAERRQQRARSLPRSHTLSPPRRPTPKPFLPRRSLSSGEGKKLPGGEITAAQVHQIAAARHLPPCMTLMYERLSAEHHLKHYGLQQMSLFLKHVGLPLEQALLFWRSMFSPRCALGGLGQGGSRAWGRGVSLKAAAAASGRAAVVGQPRSNSTRRARRPPPQDAR
jgi:hypothetical protein